ncbi:hypothetical protein Hanom_Chr06g00502091 [Helianthus anomalus]
MVLDEVGSGVFGVTRNNGSIDGKTTITSYNSYDSLIFFLSMLLREQFYFFCFFFQVSGFGRRMYT